MKQRISSFATAFLLVFAMLLPASVQASATDICQLNGSPLCPQQLQIEENAITLSGIPDLSSYHYINLDLVNSSGENAYSQVLPYEETLSFTGIHLPAGQYKVNIYRNDARYGSYLAVTAGDIMLDWDGKTGAFVQSPALPLNLQAAGQARSDEEALAYHLLPEPDIQCDDPQIIALSLQITSDCADDYSKALAVHDWVCDHIYYDYDIYYDRCAYGDSSALATLTARKGVCAGYANLTAALLRAAGVPARYVTGYAISSGEVFPEEVLLGTANANHAWTEVFADGRWITMDTTWNSGNRWEFGAPTDSTGCYRHLYFDAAPDLFAITHAVLDGNYYKDVSVQYSDLNGVIMLPLDTIAAEMGITVTQDTTTDPGWVKYIFYVNDSRIAIWDGYQKFCVNGVEYDFPIAPQTVNGTVMVPACSLFSAAGCELTICGNHITIGFSS